MGNLLFKLIGALILAASLAAGWLWMDYQAKITAPMALPAEGTMLEVAPGSSLSQVALELEQRGIIPNRYYLIWLARSRGLSSSIKAGEYRLNSGMSTTDLLERLVRGEVISHSLTLLEGWNFRQVRQAMEADDAIAQTLQGVPDDEVMARIGHPGEHPEGRFFPDTYFFPRGTSDVAFLRRAYLAMEERLGREWEARAEGLPLTSPYEALVLASIIEKETGMADERAEIAGVFVRRLRKGMLLQTDPTVIYGIGAEFDGNIRRQHLKQDTPYNTYTRKGLPPTPIAMPGGEALHAALHPADGNSLYFVAKGDGGHYFSATLAEHNQAVRRYQLRR